MRSCKLNHDSKLKLNADNFGFICPGFDIFAPTFNTNEVNGIRFVVLAALKKVIQQQLLRIDHPQNYNYSTISWEMSTVRSVVIPFTAISLR